MSANVRPQHCWGEEWGDDEMNPKPNKKLPLGAVLGPFPVILLKLATLRSPPTPNKVEFCAKWVEMSAFYTKHGCGELGTTRWTQSWTKDCRWEQCWDLFKGYYLKTYPSGPLPPQTKLNFAQNGWKWVLFLPQHCWGELGDDGMNPKPNKKWLLGAGFYVTITWKDFFTQP